MKRRVAVISVGYSGLAPETPYASYKELMFDAASKAYAEANIDPRKDVGSFVCCDEDFWEGISITDEYMPDQLGAALRPLCTVGSDGLVGVATACMHILSGVTQVAVVESHSKISDVVSKREIELLALEPTFSRLMIPEINALAALEMRRFMHESKVTRTHCSEVVAKNKRNALHNPRASFGGRIDPEDVSESPTFWDPIKELDVSPSADGCIVTVLASKESYRKYTREPVWIDGISWASGTPVVEEQDFGRAVYAEIAAKNAYRAAGVKNPTKEIDFAEIDDTYSYKELQHLEALGFCEKGEAGKFLERGATRRSSEMPVNVSGGTLGLGHMLDATGLLRFLEAYYTLSGKGPKSLRSARTGLVQSWRGMPSPTGAVVILRS